MRTRPLGSAVGALAGLAFVLASAGAVPGSAEWRIVAVLVFVAILWLVVVRGPAVEHEPPSRSALRTYGFSVTAMAVAIPLGAAVIRNALDRPHAVLVWVVLVVGVHFWPFARAFDLPVFGWLAAGLVLVAAVGAVPALASDSAAAAAWTGIAAGLVLSIFSAAGPWLTRTTASHPT